MNPGTAVARSTPSPRDNSSCLKKKPVHHVLHGTHFCQTMLLSQYLFFNNRQGQFSVWKQCLSTSRFSSTSSNWQLRPHKHFFSSLAQQKCTLCHISLSTTMNTMSAPLPFLSSLPSHVARFHLKPFHFTCSFLIQVWASPFAPLLRKNMHGKAPCRLGPFHFLLFPPHVLHVLQLPQRGLMAVAASVPPVHQAHLCHSATCQLQSKVLHRVQICHTSGGGTRGDLSLAVTTVLLLLCLTWVVARTNCLPPMSLGYQTSW